MASLWGCGDPLAAAQDPPAIQSPPQLSAQVFSTMIPCHTHKLMYLLHLITHTADGCPCHPLGPSGGHGDNRPQLGNGDTFSHGALTFGDSTQLNTSAASKRIKPPESGALPSFLGWSLPGTGLCLLGRVSPCRQRSTTGKNADTGKSIVPWGGRACPPDYFWFVSASSGATDLCWCHCCD